jgi:hypothetical protein
MRALAIVALAFVLLGQFGGPNYPDTPFFREVAREHRCIKPDAPAPHCSGSDCSCHTPWRYVPNPGHCEPLECAP